jgi:transmembrane sensor
MNTARNIDREAADWVIRRDASGDALMQQPEFQAWINADVRHRAAFLRLNAAWERSRLVERLRPLDGPVDRHLLSPRPPVQRAWLSRWPLAAAASLLVIAGVSFWWVQTQAGWQTYSTQTGAFERVRLQDGSLIQLNTNSKVRVRFTATLRHVQLSRGEAHFTVAHDAHRPFDVRAADNTVRAIGTAFSVRLRTARQIEVVVTEGRVVVAASESSPGRTWPLLPDKPVAAPLPVWPMANSFPPVR